MKTPVAAAALSIAALLGFAALPAFSGEAEQTPISGYCAAHGDLGLSHGACVAYLTTHNVAPHDAAVCHDAWIQNLLGVRNHGLCVQKLGEMRR